MNGPWPTDEKRKFFSWRCFFLGHTWKWSGPYLKVCNHCGKYKDVTFS